MTDSFESFQSCLAEFEKTWKPPKGVHCLEEALEIYHDLGNGRDHRFDNLIQLHGRKLEKKTKEIFDSPEVDSDQYVNREFFKTIFNELSLFTQFQSIEEGFGRPIIELLALLNVSKTDSLNTEGVRTLGERRQIICNLSDHKLKIVIDVLRNSLIKKN